MGPAAANEPDPRPVQQTLLRWYGENQRDLPWRRNPNPYHTVVSEIMLQQTQVDRVVPFFVAFVERFPGFQELAESTPGEVIRLWGGLGYNRRAVHLHRLAQAVTTRHGGILPSDRDALLALPGVGPYTAGAILSIAFGQDQPALDTNVRRVVGRLCFTEPPSPRELAAAAVDLLPPGRAGTWNQALMDIGSAICLARRPHCLICPLQAVCSSAGRVAAANRRAPASLGPGFTSTNRYFRGRFLAELRAIPQGSTAPLTVLAGSLAAQGVAEPPLGWEIIGRALAGEGLATLHETADEVALGLA